MFKNDWNEFRFAGVVLLLATVAASAANRFPDYPVHPAGQYAIHVERSGVTIGVEPIEDLDNQKAYFDAKLTPRGFIPVFVLIQNDSTANTFLFDQTNIGFGGASSRFRPNLGLNKIQENLVKRAIKSATLLPGSSVHGYLYIPVPRKGTREKVHLQVPITKAGTNETFVLNLYF